jgi:hypothetical protein
MHDSKLLNRRTACFAVERECPAVPAASPAAEHPRAAVSPRAAAHRLCSHTHLHARARARACKCVCVRVCAPAVGAAPPDNGGASSGGGGGGGTGGGGAEVEAAAVAEAERLRGEGTSAGDLDGAWPMKPSRGDAIGRASGRLSRGEAAGETWLSRGVLVAEAGCTLTQTNKCASPRVRARAHTTHQHTQPDARAHALSNALSDARTRAHAHAHTPWRDGGTCAGGLRSSGSTRCRTCCNGAARRCRIATEVQQPTASGSGGLQDGDGNPPGAGRRVHSA